MLCLSMNQAWNTYNLKPPPFITVKHSRTQLLKDVSGIPEALRDVTNLIQQVTKSEQLDNEIFLLTRLIYKIRNNLGGQKIAKGLKMVKKCLMRWKALNMAETLEPLKEDFRMLSSVTTSNTVYVQSALCLKHVLNKLLGSAMLLGQTASYTMHTFICAYQNLVLGLFVPKMLIFMALMSRIRILCLSMMQPLFQCYSCAYKLLFQVYGVQYLDGFPENLEVCIKAHGYCTSVVSHLDQKKAKSFSNLDAFLSKYAAEPELGDKDSFVDMLNDSGIRDDDQHMEKILSEFDKQKADMSEPDDSVGSSLINKPTIEEVDVPNKTVLCEDLGMRVSRKEQQDLSKSHAINRIRHAISMLPKCKSVKNLLALLEGISVYVHGPRRKEFKSLLQALKTKSSLQTKCQHKETKAESVTLIRKRIASFLKLLIKNAEMAVHVDPETGSKDETGRLPSEKKDGDMSKQMIWSKEGQPLARSHRQMKKMLRTAKRKGHSTKKMLELLLKAKKDAKIYQPQMYKKILKNIRLEKNLKEELGEDVQALLKGIIMAMEEKLTLENKLEENGPMPTDIVRKKCKYIRTKLRKGFPVSRVIKMASWLAEVAAKHMPERYNEVKNLITSRDNALEIERSLIINFVEAFAKDCLKLESNESESSDHDASCSTTCTKFQVLKKRKLPECTQSKKKKQKTK